MIDLDKHETIVCPDEECEDFDKADAYRDISTEVEDYSADVTGNTVSCQVTLDIELCCPSCHEPFESHSGETNFTVEF